MESPHTLQAAFVQPAAFVTKAFAVEVERPITGLALLLSAVLAQSGSVNRGALAAQTARIRAAGVLCCLN